MVMYIFERKFINTILQESVIINIKGLIVVIHA